jgi:hypothetical protein
MFTRRLPRVLMAFALLIVAPADAQPLAAGPTTAVRYDDHVIARVNASTPEDLALLESLGARMISCELSPQGGDFVLPRRGLADLHGAGYQAKVTCDDVQTLLDAESTRVRASLERYRQRGGGEGFFDDFRPLSEIDTFIDDLIARRPDLVSRFVIGHSHEGRPIWGVRISSGDPGCKPAFLMTGVTHAREWLTVMNVLYLADHLVSQEGVDPVVTDLVERVEWLIIPVLNPDGYHYTWTTDRYWRKNRRTPPESRPTSWGVDPNRNYSHRWGRPGSTSNPNSGTYRGPSPFSEPETSALRDFALANPQIRAHNDVHSYGNYILFPWCQLTQKSPDHAEYAALGDAMSQLIEDADGGKWRVGPVSTTLYLVSGGSVDWFYTQTDAISFSYELRGGSFAPGASQIIPGSRETIGATLHHAAYVADHSSFRADLDGDCDFDYDDIIAFLTAYAGQEPEADFTTDGSFDIDDVLAFIEAFASMS